MDDTSTRFKTTERLEIGWYSLLDHYGQGLVFVIQGRTIDGAFVSVERVLDESDAFMSMV